MLTVVVEHVKTMRTCDIQRQNEDKEPQCIFTIREELLHFGIVLLFWLIDVRPVHLPDDVQLLLQQK